MTRFTIYWLTKNRRHKRDIMRRFRIRGESVNGESIAEINDPDEAELLRECGRRGFIKIRNK